MTDCEKCKKPVDTTQKHGKGSDSGKVYHFDCIPKEPAKEAPKEAAKPTEKKENPLSEFQTDGDKWYDAAVEAETGHEGDNDISQLIRLSNMNASEMNLRTVIVVLKRIKKPWVEAAVAQAEKIMAGSYKEFKYKYGGKAGPIVGKVSATSSFFSSLQQALTYNTNPPTKDNPALRTEPAENVEVFEEKMVGQYKVQIYKHYLGAVVYRVLMEVRPGFWERVKAMSDTDERNFPKKAAWAGTYMVRDYLAKHHISEAENPVEIVLDATNPDRDAIQKTYPEASMTDAVEFALYAENDADIYRQRLQPWTINFGRKMAAGKFDRKLAVGALADYLAKEVQTKYFKEVGGGYSSAPEMTKATKLAFGELMLDSMMEEIQNVADDIKAGRRNKLGHKKGENPPGACSRCGKPMNPVESMMGPVCGICAREQHARIAGRPAAMPAYTVKCPTCHGARLRKVLNGDFKGAQLCPYCDRDTYKTAFPDGVQSNPPTEENPKVEQKPFALQTLANKLSQAVGGSPAKLIGEFRWSESNISAMFTTYSPHWQLKYVCVVSLFKDGRMAISFFASESLSETERFENITHFNYPSGAVKEMVEDIQWVGTEIDSNRDSWGDAGDDENPPKKENPGPYVPPDAPIRQSMTIGERVVTDADDVFAGIEPGWNGKVVAVGSGFYRVLWSSGPMSGRVTAIPPKYVIPPHMRANPAEAENPPDPEMAGVGSPGMRVWKRWLKIQKLEYPKDAWMRDYKDSRDWFLKLYTSGQQGHPLQYKPGGMPLDADERAAIEAGQGKRNPPEATPEAEIDKAFATVFTNPPTTENPGEFFTAKVGSPGKWGYGGYWTVVFNPTGTFMSRKPESAAIKEANDLNALFSNDVARTHPFVGATVASFNADGSLYRTYKIVAVARDPPGLKLGTVEALLDDSHVMTDSEEGLKREIEAVKQRISTNPPEATLPLPQGPGETPGQNPPPGTQHVETPNPVQTKPVEEKPITEADKKKYADAVKQYEEFNMAEPGVIQKINIELPDKENPMIALGTEAIDITYLSSKEGTVTKYHHKFADGRKAYFVRRKDASGLGTILIPDVNIRDWLYN